MAKTCECSVKVRATDVSAVIHKGFLATCDSVDPELRRLKPIRYEVLEFCARPTCEKVFRAEKAA
jgi:hypothetical protein